jgi:hypothetical protein
VQAPLYIIKRISQPSNIKKRKLVDTTDSEADEINTIDTLSRAERYSAEYKKWQENRSPQTTPDIADEDWFKGLVHEDGKQVEC